MTTPASPLAPKLMQITMQLIRSLSAEARQGEDGLEPAQIGILMRLEMGGACSLTDLAKHNSVKLPTVSRSVNVLVKAGLVSRSIPPENRRVTMLALTSEGKKKLLQSKKKTVAHVSGMLAILTKSEEQQVEAALNILIKVLSQ